MDDGGAQHSGPITGFKIITRATPAERRRNVQHALTLGLPELRQRPARRDALHIMATGPSFVDSPVGLHPAMAVNAALGLMAARGETPTWWAACDPQASVAEFVRTPPLGVRYLVASVCHPDVFDALLGVGAHVTVFHCSDDDRTQGYADLIEGRDGIVERMASITTTAFGLADMLGFARRETWGWDGCFRGTCDHAGAQQDGRQPVTIDVGGVTIPTARVWIYEMYGALALQRARPRQLTVHGDGLFARALEAARAA